MQTKEFFTGATYKRVGGEQLTAKCMYCSVLVTSTGATRLLDHLVKCSLCPSEVRERFAALRNITHSKRKEKQESEALMKEEAERQLCQAKVQKVLVQPGIRGSLKTAEAVNADEAIARFFYVNGISFAAADTAVDSYYKEMCRAIKAAPMGYIPPNRNALAGPLLDSCHQKMMVDINARDAGGVLSNKFGVDEGNIPLFEVRARNQ
mmetsp:Transcript_15687/g.27266  ORF Transcript_15687/g.27266 Transcript_15687/m.27266 type:complete len:207 (+) Transcript_15687:3-623(+)